MQEAKVFVSRITTRNYRCQPDGEIGPFARFNLIYGRNGAGKTSLIEAMQLALSGTSFRVGSEDLAGLKREPGETLEIDLFGPDGGLGSFREKNLQTDPLKLLKEYYGIEVNDGRKGRYILPQMLITHNILYSERVVRFLEANEKDELRSAFSELTMGRKIVETWERISLAQSICASLEEELRARNTEVTEELRVIDEAIKSSREGDIKAAEKELATLKCALPPSLRHHVAQIGWPAESQHLTSLTSLCSALNQGKEAADSLRLFSNLFPEAALTLRALSQQLNSFSQQHAAMKESLLHLEEELEVVSKEKANLESSRRVASQSLEKIEPVRTRLQRAERLLSVVTEWSAELSACLKQRASEASLAQMRRDSALAQEALYFARQTLAEKGIQELSMQRESLTSVLASSNGRIEEARDNQDELERQIVESEEASAEHRSHASRLFELITQIQEELAASESNGEPECSCPTCGHKWSSKASIMAAVVQQLNTLSKGLDDAGKQEQHRAELRGEIARLSRIQMDESQKLAVYRAQLEDISGKLTQNRELIGQAEAMCERLGIKLEFGNVGEEVFISIAGSLERRSEQLNADILRRESELGALWIGLRKEHFQQQQELILDSLQELQEALEEFDPNLDLLKPEGLAGIRDNLSTRIGEASRIAQSLADELHLIGVKHLELSNSATEISAKADEIRKRIEFVANRIAEISRAEGAARTLIELGIASENEQIAPADLFSDLQVSSARAESLCREIRILSEHEANLSRLKEQSDELRRKHAALQSQIKSVVETGTVLAQLPSLDDFESKTWSQYSEAVSMIFRKLHWPQDFDGVNLAHEGEKLDLFVQLKGEPHAVVPAYMRMSSGQRTALAISVFWAFNTIGRVPSFIAMDEPIQSIDDLNMPNFLDDLRWLIENTNRQVFMTTANQRIQSLVRRKFSYLGNDYLETSLQRDGALSSVEYLDAEGKPRSDRQLIA